ncbi:hypothetical protein GGR50DRAFT_236333 [Xylaria sp. CBS 124048]|nr:hypothetical protein GGR50DRAFT_236333 [Xylaria sp. CBS 124048]
MSSALPVYRNLLRAVRLAFQGDGSALSAARSSIRQGFRDNATLEPSSSEFRSAVIHAQDVATILRQNVVQGKREGDTYKLRIHDDIERGDNNSVKFAGKTLKQGSVKSCCS